MSRHNKTLRGMVIPSTMVTAMWETQLGRKVLLSFVLLTPHTKPLDRPFGVEKLSFEHIAWCKSFLMT